MIEFKIKLFEDDPINVTRVVFAAGKLCARKESITHFWEDDEGTLLIVVDGATFEIHGESYDDLLKRLR